MPESATLTRHRDKNGEISRKHGNTLVRTLRKTYGAHFAQGCDDNEKLSDVLHTLDEPSLSALVRDHENGRLERACRD
jgi:hypothetical protein